MKKYTHQCSGCNFLGHYKGFDLYFCTHGRPTILQRYGHKPEDYFSGLTFGLCQDSDEARECIVRALMISEFRNLIIEKTGYNSWKFLQERIKEADERIDLNNIPDKLLPLFISSLKYESNKEILRQRLSGKNQSGKNQSGKNQSGKNQSGTSQKG